MPQAAGVAAEPAGLPEESPEEAKHAERAERSTVTSLPGIAALYEAEIEQAVAKVSGEYEESTSGPDQ